MWPFIRAEHGFAIGREIEKRGIRKRYYLETRADVTVQEPRGLRLLAPTWTSVLFLGLEAIDEDGLKAHRKRVSLGTNSEALEVARAIGVSRRGETSSSTPLG